MKRTATLVLTLTLLVVIPAQAQDIIWSRTYGFSGTSELGQCGAVVSDGGYIIGGLSTAFPNGDFWMVRTDSVGDTIWTRNYGMTRWQSAFYVIETSNGGFAICGENSAAVGDDQVYIVRIDANGDTLWTRNFGAAGNHDNGKAIIETSDHGFLALGNGYDGNTDLYMIKLDSLGTLLWSRLYGGIGSEVGYGVVEMPDGGFGITGSTSTGSIGGSDLWLLRTDSVGDTLWTRKYDFHAGLDRGDGIVLTNDGGFAIGGRTWNGTYAQLLAMRTDSFGNLIWSAEFGIPATGEFAESIDMTPDGGFVIGGGKGTSSFDYFVVRLSANGDSLWAATYNGTAGDSDDCFEIRVDSNGDIMAFGYSDIANPGYDTEYWLLKIADGAAQSGCDYVVGDVNGSDTYNGLDITYGVSYFKGGVAPVYECECPPHGAWFVSGDVNSSCSYNGLDITFGVSYFKGGTAPTPCQDCPPAR